MNAGGSKPVDKNIRLLCAEFSIRLLGKRHDNVLRFLASIKLNCNLVARSMFGQNWQQLRTFVLFYAMPMPMRSHSRTGEAKKQRHAKN